ncbi:MAG: hypothetical protein C6Y22_18945 [Hapalosiphonaceae cyanobacterium JJU2]|nr:MAG: hypothetical protein C6Y22_18945 [Hapalosiphonaceae cyanobacterium JJU2]
MLYTKTLVARLNRIQQPVFQRLTPILQNLPNFATCAIAEIYFQEGAIALLNDLKNNAPEIYARLAK